jgi:hypothetical protein
VEMETVSMGDSNDNNSSWSEQTSDTTETLEFFKGCENGLDRIPPELWRSVVVRTDYEDYPAMRNVCSMFRDFVDASPWSWKKNVNITVNQIIQNQKIYIKKIGQYRVLEALAVTGLKEEEKMIPVQFLRNLANTCSSLSTLVVTNCRMDLEALKLIDSGCSKLRLVRLDGIELVAQAESCTSIGLFNNVCNITLNCTFLINNPVPLPGPAQPVQPMDFQAAQPMDFQENVQ